MVSITDKAEFLNFWNREAVEFNTLHSHQIMFDEKTIFETFLYYKNHLQDFQTHNKATDFITSINGILQFQIVICLRYPMMLIWTIILHDLNI